LESDAVNAYLGLHNLPATDAHIIYDYSRADLRNAIRGMMFDALLGIIETPASQRTPHQQSLYNWLQSLVQQNEIAEYTLAINQFNAWQNDPCTFTLDPQIATEYGISYDGTPFCFAGLNTLFGGPPVPAESYFIAYGLKHSYGNPASTYLYFGSLIAGTAVNTAEVVGIASGVAGPIVAGADAALVASLLAVLEVAGTGQPGRPLRVRRSL